jgi:hypothetical protein
LKNIANKFELVQAKNELSNELRLLWLLEENERKKKINRLLLKWQPDKNPGKQKLASKVFKHLKKKIELYPLNGSDTRLALPELESEQGQRRQDWLRRPRH